MKVNHNQFWTEELETKHVNIGFTKDFIDNVLGECFHILQADTKVIVQHSPMLVIETNDGLQSIKSPISGRVTNFNAKARNFPDRLSEEDIILTILPNGIVLPKPKKQTLEETKAQYQGFDFNADMIRELNRVENRRRGAL